MNDGGPAFPMHPSAVPMSTSQFTGIGYTHGMSLRDWFAGQALPAVIKQYAEANNGIGTDHLLTNCPVHAYRIADAMLRVRTQPKED